MSLKLQELENKDKQTWKAQAKYLQGWDNINGILYYHNLFTF